MNSWQKQTSNPLYPDLLWAKPVTKRGAGKLLTVGGNSHGFALVAQVYANAVKAGAGHIRTVVPDSLEKLTRGLEFIEYAPSNLSGGFAKSALGMLLDLADWSDGVLLAGDLAKNSETTQLLDSFLMKYSGALVVDNEALTSLDTPVADLLGVESRVVLWTRRELQKAVIELKMPQAITTDTSQAGIVQVLQEITERFPASIVLYDNSTIWTASEGSISSTKSISFNSAPFAVWAIQNPTKLPEALVTAAWELSQNNL